MTRRRRARFAWRSGATVPEHKLDDSDVHAVGQQPARALVSQAVPAQIDAAQLFLVLFGARLKRGLVGTMRAVRQRLLVNRRGRWMGI